MSRIHEALKKAEQERATVQAASGGVLTAAPTASPTMPTVARPESEGQHPLPTEELIAHSAGYLRFDDLRKHCAHPQWHLDPSVNVFINSALTAHGSEQFRTLAFAPIPDARFSVVAHSAGHQFRSVRGQNVRDQ